MHLNNIKKSYRRPFVEKPFAENVKISSASKRSNVDMRVAERIQTRGNVRKNEAQRDAARLRPRRRSERCGKRRTQRMWVVNLRPIRSDRRVCQPGAAGGSMVDRCVSARSRGGRTSSTALFLTLHGVTWRGNEDHFSPESLVKKNSVLG